MIPVLFTIGSFPVSSFGLMLAIGIFAGSFSVFRIAKAYDFDSEKILDLIFLVAGGGLLAARLVFVLTNPEIFNSLTRIFFVNLYPGLSFWGGFAGGLLVLYLFCKRLKIPFYQAGDFAIIGFLLASFFAEIGCLLGSCGIGVKTWWFFGVEQAGFISNRFPVQLFEAFAFLWIFMIFWRAVLKFYIQGALLAKGIILTGLIKLISEFFKSDSQTIQTAGLTLNINLIFGILILFLGLNLHYKVNKKPPLADLASVYKLLSDRKTQSALVTKISRFCYNQWVNFIVGLGKGRKKLFKLLNIRSNPESFK